MKIALRIILFLVLGLVVLGYFLKSTGNSNGKILIGSGIFILAFLLMPLFIYSRYNGRISDFVDKRMEKEED